MSDLLERKKALEERRRKLEARKLLLEQKRRLEEEEISTEEAVEVDEKRKELEARRKRLEEKRKLLLEQRKQEDEELSRLQEVQKAKEIEEERRREDEELKRTEQQEEQELERRRKELEDRRKALQQRRRALDEARNKEDDQMKQLETSESDIDSTDLESKQKELQDRRANLELKRKQLEEARARREMEEAEGLLEKKRLLEQRRKELEKRKKALAELAESDLTKAKADLEFRKEQLARRRSQLSELQTTADYDDFAKKKVELETRRKIFEERKAKLEAEKQRTKREAEDKVAEDQEEINQRRAELEARKHQIKERKKMLQDIREMEELQAEQDIIAEQELARKRIELEEKKKLIEERRKLLEEARQKEQREEEEMRLLEERKKELEDRRRRLEDRKKSLEEVRVKEEKEMEAKAIEDELQKKRKEIEVRRMALDQRKKMLEEAKSKEDDAKKADEEQEQLNKMKADIEDRRKKIHGRKNALEALKAKQETEMLVIEDEQVLLEDKEEMNELKLKKMQLEDRRKKLDERKRMLTEKRAQELEEEKRAKEESESLESKRKELEDERKIKQEKISPETEQEVELKRKELEERKRRIEERRKELEERRVKDQLAEKEELILLTQKEQEIQKRETEVDSRLKNLEEKEKETRERSQTVLATLSAKEEEYMKYLSPSQREALQSVAATPKKGLKVSGLFRKSKGSPNEAPPPAPPSEDDWKEAITSDGKKYYYNPVTKESRWDKPKASQFPPPKVDTSKLTAQERDIFSFLTPDEQLKLVSGINERKALSYDPVLYEAARKEREREDKLSLKRRKEEELKAKQKDKGDKRKSKKDERSELAYNPNNKKAAKKAAAQYNPGKQLSKAEEEYLAALSPSERDKLLGTEGKSLEPQRRPSRGVTMFGRRTSSFAEKNEKLPEKLDDSTDLTISPESSRPPSLGKSISKGGSFAESPGNSLRGRILPPLPEKTTDNLAINDAVKQGDKEKVKALLKDSSMDSLNAKDEQGHTPLHIAALNGNLDMVQFIVSEAPDLVEGKLDLNVKDQNGRTPLVCAAFSSSSKEEKISHMKICEFLLQQEEIDALAETNDLNTPLHYFVRLSPGGKGEEYRILYENVLNLLVQKGADPNAQNFRGETCLHQAALRGSKESVYFLLDLVDDHHHHVKEEQPKPGKPIDKKLAVAGVLKNLFSAPPGSKRLPGLRGSGDYRVALDIQNTSGETALHYAAKGGNLEIVTALVKRWADISVVSNQQNSRDKGVTAAEIAASFNAPDVAKYLKELVKHENQTKLQSTEWLNVFTFLSPQTLCKIAVVCKQFRRLTNNDKLWKEKCFEKHVIRKGVKHSWKKVWKKEYIDIRRWINNKIRFNSLEEKQLIRAQAFARGFVARSRYKKMRKHKVQRDKLVKELVDTEKTYVDHLTIIVKLFLNPLRNKAKADPAFIPMSKVTTMFSDIEVILKTNTILLERLTEKLKLWTDTSTIGDVFLSLSESFKFYAPYVNNFDRSLAVYEECKKSPGFQEWIRPRENIKSLNSLLIMPIQRVPRYNLLLRDIIKYTWPDHTDYKSLCAALDKMEKLAGFLNLQKGQAENRERLMNVEQCIDPSPELSRNAKRKYIMEGEFTEIMKSQKIPIYFFLLSDVLIFCRPQKKRTIPPRYKFLKMEKLYSIAIQDIEDSSYPNTLEITTTSKVHTISSLSPAMRDDFYQALKQAVAAEVSSRSKGNANEIAVDLIVEEEDNSLEISPDLPPDQKIKVLERALFTAKRLLQEEKRLKEQLALSKKNLEEQVKQLMSHLNEETKAKEAAENQLKNFGGQGKTGLTGGAVGEADPLDKMALTGLTEKDKVYLCNVVPSEKRAKIELLRKLDDDPKKKQKVEKKLEKKRKEEEKLEKQRTLKEQKKAEKDAKTTLGRAGSISSMFPSRNNSIRGSFESKDFTPSIHGHVKDNNTLMVRNMLDLGTSINSINSTGQTALHIAAARGNYEMVQFLITESPKGDPIDINLQDDLGQTPLHTAAAKACSKDGKVDHLKVCELLLQQDAIKVDISTYELDTPLHFIAAISTWSKDSAFKVDHMKVLNLLLSKGLNPNLQNNKGETCLHRAALEGAVESAKALLATKTERVKRTVQSKLYTNESVDNKKPIGGVQLLPNRAQEGKALPIPVVEVTRVYTISDVNITNDVGETPLHCAVKSENLEMVSLLVTNWADLSIKNRHGTAEDLAKILKHEKIHQYLEGVREKEKRLLSADLWARVFGFVNPKSYMEPIPLVCHEFRRASGKVKSALRGAQRQQLRKQLENALKERKTSSGDKQETLESLRLSKITLESQVKQAVNLLAEESKRRSSAEKRMKEMQDELDLVKDPDRVKKLEETVKKQRLANDSLQQQFVVQMETIGNLEKKLKEYRTVQYDMETKYEERVYFMEERARKDQENISKESGSQVMQLAQTKSQLEQQNKLLLSRLEDLGRKLAIYRGEPVPDITAELRDGPAVSTGPKNLPPRPKSAIGLNQSSPDIPSRPSKPAPSLPPLSREESKKSKVGGAKQQPELGVTGQNPIGNVPALPSTVQPSGTVATKHITGILFDIWESSTTIVVAFDVPGVDMKLLDIYISRFSVTISRKCGAFEEKHIGPKYKPQNLQRLELGKIGQFIKDQIVLPCAVQPGRKQAFFHHGTVYLQLERLVESYGELQFNDWMPTPNF